MLTSYTKWLPASSDEACWVRFVFCYYAGTSVFFTMPVLVRLFALYIYQGDFRGGGGECSRRWVATPQFWHRREIRTPHFRGAEGAKNGKKRLVLAAPKAQRIVLEKRGLKMQ